jgi:hypothetical protein
MKGVWRPQVWTGLHLFGVPERWLPQVVLL